MLTLIFGSCIVLGSSHVSVAPVGRRCLVGCWLDSSQICFCIRRSFFRPCRIKGHLQLSGLEKEPEIPEVVIHTECILQYQSWILLLIFFAWVSSLYVAGMQESSRLLAPTHAASRCEQWALCRQGRPTVQVESQLAEFHVIIFIGGFHFSGLCVGWFKSDGRKMAPAI